MCIDVHALTDLRRVQHGSCEGPQTDCFLLTADFHQLLFYIKEAFPSCCSAGVNEE